MEIDNIPRPLIINLRVEDEDDDFDDISTELSELLNTPFPEIIEDFTGDLILPDWCGDDIVDDGP
jgi:hypothetical protein